MGKNDNVRLQIPQSTIKLFFGLESLERRTLLTASYSITDLTTLVGIPLTYSSFVINDVNSSGEVVGTARKSSGVSPPQGFVWSVASGFQMVGPLPGGVGSGAQAINDNGQVAGTSISTDAQQNSISTGFFWSTTTGAIAVGAGSYLTAISPAGPSGTFLLGTLGNDGEEWSTSNISSPEDLGNSFTTVAVNSAGDAVGNSTDDEAFLNSTPLGFLGGVDSSSATGVNNADEVVGSVPSVAGTEAVVWPPASGTPGPITPLGFLGTGDSSAANAVNNNGIIVGLSNTTTSLASFHAFIDSSGTMQDLNNLVNPNSGWVLEAATAINDNGQIFGTGTDSNGQEATFLLTPVIPKLVFTQQPTNVAAGSFISPPIIVEIEDASGNVITNDNSEVTIALMSNSTGATIGGSTTEAAINGVATFSNLSITAAGTGYTLVATDGTDTLATSSSFSSSVPTTNKVVFAQQPTGAIATATLGAVKVNVETPSGAIVSGDTSTVTLTISSGPTGAALGGAVSVAGVAGVATFSNLTLSLPGTYTLKATDGSDTSAISSTFTLSAPATVSSQLTFVEQPTATVVGAALAPVTVDINSPTGDLQTSDSSIVTFAVTGGGVVLGGTTAVAAVGGVATFVNLTLPTPGTYTLTATDGSDTSATSTTFIVSAPASLVSTTTSVVASSPSAFIGQSVTLTATVAPASSSTAAPIGTVTFSDGSASLGTVTVQPNCTATFSTTMLSQGAHTISASYSGDSNYSQSTSASTIVQIQAPQLALSFTRLVLPTSAFESAPIKASALVSVVNQSQTADSFKSIGLFVNTTQTADGNQIPVATISRSVSLKQGKKTAFSFRLKPFAATVPEGTYYLLAEVVDSNGAAATVSSTATVLINFAKIRIANPLPSLETTYLPISSFASTDQPTAIIAVASKLATTEPESVEVTTSGLEVVLPPVQKRTSFEITVSSGTHSQVYDTTINPLPAVKLAGKPGSATLAVLKAQLTIVQDASQLPDGSVLAGSDELAAIQSYSTSLQTEITQISSIVAGTSKAYKIGAVSGHQIEITRSALALSDNILFNEATYGGTLASTPAAAAPLQALSSAVQRNPAAVQAAATELYQDKTEAFDEYWENFEKQSSDVIEVGSILFPEAGLLVAGAEVAAGIVLNAYAIYEYETATDALSVADAQAIQHYAETVTFAGTTSIAFDALKTGLGNILGDTQSVDAIFNGLDALNDLVSEYSQQQPGDTVSISTQTPDASNTSDGVFDVTRTGATDDPLTVFLSPGTDSTASSGDYTTIPDAVTIPPGDDSVDVDVEASAQPQPGGNLDLQIADDSDYQIGTDSASVTVEPTLALPSVSITADKPTASSTAGTTGEFTITLSAAATTDTTILLSVDPSSTAASNLDYSPIPDTLTIPAGQTTAHIEVTPGATGDVADKTLAYDIDAGDDYALGATTSATVTIEGVKPVVTISASIPTASATDGTTGQFTISRTGSTTTALTVTILLDSASTAAINTDFQPLQTTVTIPAGSASTTISLIPVQDSDSSSSLTVIYDVATSEGYSVGSMADATVTLAVTPGNSASISVGSGSPSNIIVDVDNKFNLQISFPGGSLFGLVDLVVTGSEFGTGAHVFVYNANFSLEDQSTGQIGESGLVNVQVNAKTDPATYKVDPQAGSLTFTLTPDPANPTIKIDPTKASVTVPVVVTAESYN